MGPRGIGLVGLGRHGMRYARHLLEPLPHVRLVAVSRRDARQGASFAAEHGVRFYQDYHKLVEDPEVQAVVVVTPPALARSVCLAGVHAGKPMLIEKPLATTGVEARDMVQAAARGSIPIMTAQTLRFDTSVTALKAARGSVGARQYLVLTNRAEPRQDQEREASDYAGRGVLLEIGIHLLDLVRFLTGEEVAEVRCELDPTLSGMPEARALVSLRTAGGFPCVVDVSRMTAGRVSRAEWVGDHGQISADWVHHRLRTISGGNVVHEEPVEYRPTVVATILAFAEALERGRPMPITGLDGQRAVEIVDACYLSAERGEAVQLTGL